ncbi:hypothetical protein Mapa_009607 [Marchantia paleacea]|nr:hypothetical protein Mapa_009607 [Marchantia paleacea]
MEFIQGDDSRSKWLEGRDEPLKKIHIVDTLPDFHYDTTLQSMYMDVVRPADDHRLFRSCKTGLLLRDNETIHGPCTLNTGGIAGAQVPPLYKFTNRGPNACQNLAKCWADLEKSTPSVLIPEHVNKPCTILEAKDIKGASSHPKNMKVGNEARDTNPMEPLYSLPSYVEPWIPLPKFLRDSLNVGDIQGTRPSSRHKRLERGSQLSVSDIEGCCPGWRPFHRRKFGKEARNLCLEVEDISGPFEERVVRPSTSEVYCEIEGSHSKELTRTRNIGTPQDLSLKIDDIKGAYAGSGTWEDATRRRKEFANNHTLDEKEQKVAQDSALQFLRTRMQDQIKLKQLSSKDVASTFELLDRQKSGKLDINEVNRAFKTLRLDVCPSDLKSISKAFVHPNGDGYLDYWKLVQHMVPLLPKKHGAGWDDSNNVGRSVDQGIKSPVRNKPCYDPSWVPDWVASHRVQGSGNEFQPFNSGRPITVSKYLKYPGSDQRAPLGRSSEPVDGATQSTKVSNSVQGVQFTQQAIPKPSQMQTMISQIHSVQLSDDLNSHMAADIFREVPVLSVLQECEPQPAQIIKDVHFQEIVPGKVGKVRRRDDSLFLILAPPREGPLVESSSEPIFDKLKGLNNHEVKPLPIGGPFWPGHVEVLPENLAPPLPKVSVGPLPMGVPFWSGTEKSQPTPRASLRKDYPVPPLFSQVHSDVTLRKAGQVEKKLNTWVDRVGDAAATLTFVGEGNQVLGRSGMKGNAFTRPGSAPFDYRPHSSRAGVRTQTPSTWAYTSGADEWVRRSSSGEPRPQTVNSLVRGSPVEYPQPAKSENRSISQKGRPSTAQTCIRNVSSESCFPSPRAFADKINGMKINHQAQCNDRRGPNKAISVSEQRFHAQLKDDLDAVRLLR